MSNKSFKELYDLGYTAAANGENRMWCAQYGLECLLGYDAYWERYGMQ